MNVIIMAGGKGTRIASIKSNVPKPMIKIGGKPILEYQIDNLRRCGLTDITLVIGYLGDIIKDYFGDGSRFGVNISYYEELSPLGTAGALLKMNGLSEDFVLMCGDLMMDVDFERFITFHNESEAWASLMVHPNDHPFDSSIIVTETLEPQRAGGFPIETHRVTKWINKEDKRMVYRNLVNAGVEIISPKLIEHVRQNFVPRHPENPDKVDLDRDMLKPNITSGKIFAYHTTEYIKDMGTPERFHEVERDLLSGKINARNLERRQKAVFLDRDGTINIEKGFLTDAEDFELIEGAAKAIRMINQSEYLAVVCTNQPVIARGECTFDKLREIHDKMETLLGQEGAYLDAIYYCPHHPDKGFEGERPEYKIDCDCRKPNDGLLRKAAADFNIDLSESIMIGDREKDIEAGERAGCKLSLSIGRNEPAALLNAIMEILK